MIKTSILSFLMFLVAFVLVACSQTEQPEKTHIVWLDDLPIESFSDGIRPVNRNPSSWSRNAPVISENN